MIRGVRKKIAMIVLAAIAMTATMLTPNSVNISGYPVSNHRVTSGCTPAPRENFGLIKLRAEFKVANRPNEFAVIFATDRNFSLGIALTIDKYGNIFVSTRSAYSADTYKYAVLLSAPSPVGSRHSVDIDLHVDKRIKIKFDGKIVPLVDVNNGSTINTREMRTEVNELCTKRFGTKDFNGVALITLKQYELPINIQLTFLRMLMLLCALGLAILVIKESSRDKLEESQ